MIFDRKKESKIVFYDGTNKKEVIHFFSHPDTKHYGQCLTIIDDELHFIVPRRDWETKQQTLIKPNHYITFKYDEDSWYGCYHFTIEEFKERFVEVLQ